MTAITDVSSKEQKLKTFCWLILVLSAVRFFMIGVVYSDQAYKFDTVAYPEADPAQVTRILFAVTWVFFGNVVLFGLAFVLLYGVLKKNIYCFCVWMVVSVVIVLVDFILNIYLTAVTKQWLMALMVLIDVILSSMIGGVCYTFWKIRQEKSEVPNTQQTQK